jgi:hypothetical protein
MPISQIVTNSIADDVTIKFADGSASTPSITNNGDTNTGIFFPAADTIAFSEGGVESMRITSAGDVGIGTTAPTFISGTGMEVSRTGGTAAIQATRTDASTAGGIAIQAGSGQNNLNSAGAKPLVFYTDSTDRMRIDSSGNLLINGTSNPVQAKVGITQTAASGWAQSLILGNTTNGTVYTNTSGTANYLAVGFYNNGSTYTSVGTIQVSGSTTGYNTSSDYRLKENIAPMTGALATVALLKPVTYNWKVDGSAGQGFIAHELAEVVPDCVTGEKDAVDKDGKIMPQGIDTSFLVATLTAAIQELKAEFDEYKRTHP